MYNQIHNRSIRYTSNKRRFTAHLNKRDYLVCFSGTFFQAFILFWIGSKPACVPYIRFKEFQEYNFFDLWHLLNILLNRVDCFGYIYHSTMWKHKAVENSSIEQWSTSIDHSHSSRKKDTVLLIQSRICQVALHSTLF